MKLLNSIILGASLAAIASANATVPEHIYLVGGVCEPAWSTAEAYELSREGNTFTYEGSLNSGEFKFITERKFECPTFFAPSANYEISKEGVKDQTVSYRMEDGMDYKWNLSSKGVYRISLTVAEDPTAENGGSLSVEYLAPFETVYLIGNGCPAGWNTAEAPAFTKDGNVYTFEGILIGSQTENKEIKFLTERNFEGTTLHPDEANSVIGTNPITDQNINTLSDGDKKWIVKHTGLYRITIVVNPDGTEQNAGKLSVEYLETPPMVYMLGLAVNQFDSANAVPMSAEDGKFVWIGSIDYEATDGDAEHANKQFKFCYPKGAWNQVYFLIPETAEQAGVTEIGEGEYKLKRSYEFDGQKVLDAFFGLKDNEPTKYDYCVTVDPTAMTMKLAKTVPTGVYGMTVREECETSYYDLNGHKISSPEAPGIYIMRKGSEVKKIMK